jgi:integrase
VKLKHIMTTGSQRNISYQRRFPRELLDHPQVRDKPIYRRALGVTESDTDSAVLAAWEHAHATYEQYVDTLRGANIDQLSLADKRRRAEALIEGSGLEAGMLHRDPQLNDAQQQVLHDAALAQVEGSGALDSVVYQHQQQRVSSEEYTGPTPEEEIEDIAWTILSEPKQTRAATTLLFSECFALWAHAKSVDTSTRDGDRAKRMWDEFLALSGGDNVVTQDTAQDAVDTYVQARVASGITGSSVDTWTRKNLAILRLGIRERRLPIVLHKPAIAASTDYADDYVLTQDEELELLKIIRSGTLEPWKAAALALMLETGCGTSELQRLEPENIHLDKETPHIILKNKKMKTKSRPRLLVPVATVDVIQQGFADEESWQHFRGMGDSNASHQLKTALRKVAPKATARGLRHGTRNRLLRAGVPLDVQYLIGGWSSGVNTVALGYGRAGVTDDRTLATLQRYMRKANKAMLKRAGSATVVPIKRHKG